MRVLVACEHSGIVRDAFCARGHNAYSCDLKPGRGTFSRQHIQDNVLSHLDRDWDLMIAHPPCTHLAASGARWFPDKQDGRQQYAIWFFLELANAPIPHIAIENPVGIMSSLYREPDQIIQPWMFGHGETKATCLWLKNLPGLIETHVVPEREQRVWLMPDSKGRDERRSLTYPGIAEAMATQWTSNLSIQTDLFRHP